MLPQLRRHDLAFLRGGSRVCMADADAVVRTWLDEWIARGNPLVVTRQDASGDPVRLGAILPARLGRKRVGCSVAQSAVVRTASPLPIAAVLGRLPPGSVPALRTLTARAAELEVAVGVYGSTAWEHLSGERYRRADSDLDLVCDVTARSALAPWLAALERASDQGGLRIDGEIRFPSGSSVAWRELARLNLDLNATVLAKELGRVALTRIDTLMESFP